MLTTDDLDQSDRLIGSRVSKEKAKSFCGPLRIDNLYSKMILERYSLVCNDFDYNFEDLSFEE